MNIRFVVGLCLLVVASISCNKSNKKVVSSNHKVSIADSSAIDTSVLAAKTFVAIGDTLIESGNDTLLLLRKGDYIGKGQSREFLLLSDYTFWYTDLDKMKSRCILEFSDRRLQYILGKAEDIGFDSLSTRYPESGQIIEEFQTVQVGLPTNNGSFKLITVHHEAPSVLRGFLAWLEDDLEEFVR